MHSNTANFHKSILLKPRRSKTSDRCILGAASGTFFNSFEFRGSLRSKYSWGPPSLPAKGGMAGDTLGWRSWLSYSGRPEMTTMAEQTELNEMKKRKDVRLHFRFHATYSHLYMRLKERPGKRVDTTAVRFAVTEVCIARVCAAFQLFVTHSISVTTSQSPEKEHRQSEKLQDPKRGKVGMR